jgi:hypothetical protein
MGFMNIKNRLKKLESEIVKEDSEFCVCEGGITIRMPGDPPFPEVCEICGKPNLIKVISFNFANNLEIANEH